MILAIADDYRFIGNTADIDISHIYLLIHPFMNSSEKTWYVYMVSCSDSTLYTGITTDIIRRIDQHNSSKGGAKYTRCRQPVSLIYYEKADNRSLASRRERELKKLTRKQKYALATDSTRQ
jgi:putative endonuclease